MFQPGDCPECDPCPQLIANNVGDWIVADETDPLAEPIEYVNANYPHFGLRWEGTAKVTQSINAEAYNLFFVIKGDCDLVVDGVVVEVRNAPFGTLTVDGVTRTFEGYNVMHMMVQVRPDWCLVVAGHSQFDTARGAAAVISEKSIDVKGEINLTLFDLNTNVLTDAKLESAVVQFDDGYGYGYDEPTVDCPQTGPPVSCPHDFLQAITPPGSNDGDYTLDFVVSGPTVNGGAQVNSPNGHGEFLSQQVDRCHTLIARGDNGPGCPTSGGESADGGWFAVCSLRLSGDVPTAAHPYPLPFWEARAFYQYLSELSRNHTTDPTQATVVAKYLSRGAGLLAVPINDLVLGFTISVTCDLEICMPDQGQPNGQFFCLYPVNFPDTCTTFSFVWDFL
jgi:hypothetical protein